MGQDRELKTITGEIDHIRFQNEDGFIIASFITDPFNPPVSILGNIINPQTGLTYKLKGEFSNHPKFGKQFNFSSHESVLPTNPNGIFKYLVRMAKWVGPAIGNKLVDEFGTETLTVLKSDPKLIAKKIKGITIQKAIEIQKALLKNEENEKIQVELESLLDISGGGVPKKIIPKLIETHKSNAPTILKANPYILTQFNSVGFSLADRVALHLGYAADGIERKKAAISHVLQEEMNQGHTWIDELKLKSQVTKLIGVNKIDIGLASMQDDQKITKRDYQWAFSRIDKQERYIAEKVVELCLKQYVKQD